MLDADRQFRRTALRRARAPALITATRHRLAFEEALAHLERLLARKRIRRPNFLAEDLRLAARALERIAGRIDVEEVLGEIFSGFVLANDAIGPIWRPAMGYAACFR